MFASLAGITPKLKDWSYPLDFYINFRGKPFFGNNKTWRGLIVGMIIGILTAVIEKQIFKSSYPLVNPIILGLLLGAGAIVGDAIKSFFKRQINIAPGKSWLFFDQFDYILGGILFSFWYVRLSLLQYIFIIVVYFILHLLTNVLGFIAGLRKQAI